MGNACWENILAIKFVLHGFELVSNLRINFNKSKILGINVNLDFLQATSNFISCGISSLTFSYLGIPIDANHHRCTTWDPILVRIPNKMNVRKAKRISLNGRVTLINFVLRSLPLYFFSIFKALEGVIHEIVRIQRVFLWCCVENRKRINWVSWD